MATEPRKKRSAHSWLRRADMNIQNALGDGRLDDEQKSTLSGMRYEIAEIILQITGESNVT